MLAVVINGHREFFLGSFLPNDVLVEVLLDFQGFRELMGPGGGLIRAVIFQNGVTDSDALVANISAGVIAGG
jgi:hypothetical protein